MLNQSFEGFTQSPSDPLYSKTQKFFIKNSSGDERTRDLRIVVDFTSSLSKVSKPVLNVQVSDDEDPFFFYSLIVTEEDYQRLKTVQGLLVDFDHFPTQIVRLLEQCKEQESRESKFLLLLEEENRNSTHSYLKIVEANDFKHLCHLVLQIGAGNDDDIKQIMLAKIKSLKEANTKAENTINHLESQLHLKTKSLQCVEEKLYETQQQWKEERIHFKAESTKELTEETEKFRKLQLDWQIKYQCEKAELEEKYLLNIKDKDSELSRLRLENQILLEKRNHSDTTIADQARRIDQFERELSTVRNDLVNARKHISKMETESHDREKQINGLKTRLAVVEQESKDKTILMAKQQELLNFAQEQKLKLEETVCEKEKSLQRKMISLQNLSDELVKANEIITKLQKELSSVSSKLHVRTSIALEQEKVVDSYLKTISKLEEGQETYEKKIKAMSEMEETLKFNINELKDLLDTKEKKIKDNEKIIDWLNRRLTDYSKGPTSSHNSTALPSINGSSTPFSKSVTDNTPGRMPFSANVRSGLSSVPTIQTLDQHQTPVIIEEEENAAPNSGVIAENEIARPFGNKKTPEIPKTQAKKVPRKPPSIGFKRISPPGKATTVPSSYFLK